MPNGRKNSYDINDENRNHTELARDDGERLVGMARYRQSIQSRYHPKPEIQDVKRDKEEQNDSRHALDRVEPIARIRVCEVVRPRFGGDNEPVNCVINQWNEDAANFDE